MNEGVSTQRDSRVDVLRNLFNRFKRLDNENVQQTFDRLTDISNELQALGATDITDHEVVKKLLRSLDSSFDTLTLMILVDCPCVTTGQQMNARVLPRV